MSKERYAEHTVAWELPNGDSVTKSNYNLADIGTKYIPIQTEIISDNKDKTIAELQQQIAELEEQLKSLADHDKQVRNEVIDEIKSALRKNVVKMMGYRHCYPENAIYWDEVVTILNKIGEKEC